MEPLAEAILVEISALPEGMPVTATALLHLGSRPAVSRAFSRLMRRGKIYKISRGVYVASVVSRFGSSAPSLHKLIEELSKQLGETLVPSPAFSANALGLTTQVPVRAVYLTSGRSRKLTLGKTGHRAATRTLMASHLSRRTGWRNHSGTRMVWPRTDKPDAEETGIHSPAICLRSSLCAEFPIAALGERSSGSDGRRVGFANPRCSSGRPRKPLKCHIAELGQRSRHVREETPSLSLSA